MQNDYLAGTNPNNGQIKMAANLYSDISGLLTIFSTADRHVGGKPATFFGQDRWVQLVKRIKN